MGICVLKMETQHVVHGSAAAQVNVYFGDNSGVWSDYKSSTHHRSNSQIRSNCCIAVERVRVLTATLGSVQKEKDEKEEMGVWKPTAFS